MTTKFQVGKTYKTRDGRDVRIIATDRRSTLYPMIGLVGAADDEEQTISFMADGKYSEFDNHREFDLVDTEERWINLYNFHHALPFASRHDSRSAAEESRRSGLLTGRIKITYTDGLPTGVELVPV